MAVRRDLRLYQRNAETIQETVTADDNGQPLNLVGKTIEFIIKPTDTTPDDATTVVTLSTATGEITITDPAAGVCEVDVPAQQPGIYWRRLDVINGADRKTAIYGALHVISI